MPTLYSTDSFVKIFYTSTFGVHSHSIPTKIITTSGLGDTGTLTSWDGDPVDVATMVENFIDAVSTAVPNTTTYNRYIVYKWNPAQLYYNPVAEKAYTKVGSAVGLSGQAQAVQVSITLRTLGFSSLRLVLLDRPNNNTWGNQIPVPADYTLAINELTDINNGWAGRDNTRPANPTNATVSLNKRLRRKYGMI